MCVCEIELFVCHLQNKKNKTINNIIYDDCLNQFNMTDISVLYFSKKNKKTEEKKNFTK